MSRREELQRLAREVKPQAAVYQIRNLRTGRILVDHVLNAKALNGRRMELARGIHRNAALREDLAAHGPDAFVIEVLELLDPPEEEAAFPRDAVKQRHAAWVEKLAPFGERGYHGPPPAPRG